MKVNLTIPTSLNEITLEQYQKFDKLEFQTESELQMKMIEIFCNTPELVVRNMKAIDITDICNMLNQMFDVKHQLITSFKIDGVEYAFIPNLEDMTFGEYVDLDTYIGDNDNLHRALNVLYRPIEFKTGNRYTIKEYNPETYEIAKRFPVDAVLGSIVFFYTLGADLSKVMMNSSKKANEENLVQYLTSQQDMDGIIASIDSLTEILQNLNISPN